jgi:hypothetical protein
VTAEHIDARPDLRFTSGARVTFMAIAAALMVPVVWFGMAQRGANHGTAFDQWALKWTQTHRMTSGPLHFVLLESTGLSYAGTAALVGLVVAAAHSMVRRPRTMWAILAALAATIVLVELIGKPYFRRTIIGANAYPAGSAAFASLVSISLAVLTRTFTRRRRSWIAVYVLMMILSMAPKLYFAVLNQQHYLTDLFGGAAVGLAASLAALASAGWVDLKSGSDAINTSAGSDT